MPKLNAKKVEALKSPKLLWRRRGALPEGRIGRGEIVDTADGRARRRRDLGLGSASLIPLWDARVKAREYRRIAREGGDPDTIRKRESLSFEEAATRVHTQLLPTWRNRKHAETWLATVENYANPKLGGRPLHTIGRRTFYRCSHRYGLKSTRQRSG